MVTVAKRKSEPSGFGSRLRSLREAKGLSQSDLGELVEMTYQAIAKYERGANEPTWPTVVKLATALGVSTEEFRRDG